MRALVFVAVLGACATPRSGQDDEDRIARDADRQRANRSATGDDLRESERAPATDGSSAAMVAADAQRTARSLEAARLKGEAECARLDGKPLTEDEEQKLGHDIAIRLANPSAPGPAPAYAAAAPQQELAPDPRPDLAKYVQTVGLTLAKLSSLPNAQWVFRTRDAKGPATVSAFGGWVFVSVSAMEDLANEAELAALLAREIVHVAERHDAASYLATRASQCRIAAIGRELVVAGSTSVPGAEDFVRQSMAAQRGSLEQQFLDNWVSQRQLQPEDASIDDAPALALLTKAGYDPAALFTALERTRASLEPKRADPLMKVKPGTGRTPPFPKDLKLKK